MKMVKLLFFIIISQNCFAQINKDSILVLTRTPFVEGVIKIRQNAIGQISDPSSFVAVLSYSDSVFNIKEGVVIGILENDGDFTVIIESNNDDMHFVYDNLSNLSIKKNEPLKEGQYIGEANTYESNMNMVAISIYKYNKELSYNEVIKFFKLKEQIKDKIKENKEKLKIE